MPSPPTTHSGDDRFHIAVITDNINDNSGDDRIHVAVATALIVITVAAICNIYVLKRCATARLF